MLLSDTDRAGFPAKVRADIGLERWFSTGTTGMLKGVPGHPQLMMDIVGDQRDP